MKTIGYVVLAAGSVFAAAMLVELGFSLTLASLITGGILLIVVDTYSNFSR